MDIKIKTESEEFHCRACGIIKQNEKFLVMRVNKTDYYHIPGGHVEIGETSKDAVIREIKEEIGCVVKDATLFAIQENFWLRNGKNCHGIEFYYIIEPKEQMEQKDHERIEIDKGKECLLEFKWVTATELKYIDLKPENIKEILINGGYLNGFSYMIKQ